MGLTLPIAAALVLRERLVVEWCRREIMNGDWFVARGAAGRLARVPTARAADGLFKGLEHHTLTVRIASAEGLARVGAAARRAALDRMGNRALAAIPGLLEAVKGGASLEARIAAAEALSRFACDDETVRIALLGTAENDREEPGARIAALEALDCSGIDPRVIAPTLAALEGEPDALGALASRILREVGAEAGGRE